MLTCIRHTRRLAIAIVYRTHVRRAGVHLPSQLLFPCYCHVIKVIVLSGFVNDSRLLLSLVKNYYLSLRKRTF